MCLGALLKDIKDAFTSVWTNGLIVYKLLKYKFPIQLCNKIYKRYDKK